jgi:hypothetical protein
MTRTVWLMGSIKLRDQNGFFMDGSRMRYIPSRREIFVFATLAITCSIVVTSLKVSAHDLGLSFLAMPLFIFAALLGLRRNWSAAETEEPEEG